MSREGSLPASSPSCLKLEFTEKHTCSYYVINVCFYDQSSLNYLTQNSMNLRKDDVGRESGSDKTNRKERLIGRAPSIKYNLVVKSCRSQQKKMNGRVEGEENRRKKKLTSSK